jgi:hypothetical protein
VERPIWLVRAGPIECDDPDVPRPLPPAAADPAAPISPPGTGGTAGGPATMSRRRYNSDLALEPPFSEAEAAEAEAEAGGQKAAGVGPQNEAEAAEAGGEDDYWASFHGRASWQREPAAPAAGGGRVVYSWPPAQKASTCSWLIALAHLATCSERTLALRLPPQSVHGASLNDQGCYLARRMGRLIAAEGRKYRRPPPHIFTRYPLPPSPRAVTRQAPVLGCGRGMHARSCERRRRVCGVRAAHAAPLQPVFTYVRVTHVRTCMRRVTLYGVRIRVTHVSVSESRTSPYPSHARLRIRVTHVSPHGRPSITAHLRACPPPSTPEPARESPPTSPVVPSRAIYAAHRSSRGANARAQPQYVCPLTAPACACAKRALSNGPAHTHAHTPRTKTRTRSGRAKHAAAR